MKKKWLEGKQPAPLSQDAYEGIKAEYIIEAEILEHPKGDILELDVYEEIHGGRDNKTGGKLMCRHFLIKDKEYATYFPQGKKLEYKTYEKGWCGAKLTTVVEGGSSAYTYSAKRDAVFSSKAAAVIIQYMNKGIRSIWDTIIQEEYSISREKAARAAESKTRRIKNLMEAVEPMDRQFDQWAESLLPEEYLFVQNNKTKLGYRCHCSSCRRNYFEKKKPKHNEKVACRKCGQQVTVKTRTHDIDAEKNIMVLQNYDGEVLIRHFRLYKSSAIWNKKAESIYSITEKIRMFMAEGKKTKIYYNNGYEVMDGCGWTDKHIGMVIDTWFYLYPAGMEECPMEKGIKTALMQAAAAKKIMAYNQIIRVGRLHKYLEYMIKSRFYRLANETARICMWELHSCMNGKAENMQDMLKLDRQRALRLRELDGGIDALQALQWEKEHGEKISRENLCYIHAKKIRIGRIEPEMERTGLSVNRMLNYIRRQQEKEKTSADVIMQIYKDYLDMAQRRNANLQDDIIRVNPRLKEFHDLYAEELQREKDEKRAQKANTEFAGIEKDYLRNCRLFAWEDEEHAVIVPKNAGQIIEEGRKQHHCVGAGNTYMGRMHRREAYILFLRDKKKPEKPWYTLEVTEDLHIKQKYAAYNRQPDINKVNKILARWKKEMQSRRKTGKQEKTKGACIRAAV